MSWIKNNFTAFRRLYGFPYRVDMLYFCKNAPIGPVYSCRNDGSLEINLRISSTEKETLDYFNNTPYRTPLPNVAFKFPGIPLRVGGPELRDTIAFAYPREVVDLLIKQKLFPSVQIKQLAWTVELAQLVQDFHNHLENLYQPGVADQVDWTCFQLYHALLFNDHSKDQKSGDKNVVIRNIANRIHLHCNEKINIASLARQAGLSQTVFFREWKKIFPFTPAQYLLDCRLELAAQLLKNTNATMEEIVSTIHFSGTYAFYQRFNEKYGISPGDFRKHHCSPVGQPDPFSGKNTPGDV